MAPRMDVLVLVVVVLLLILLEAAVAVGTRAEESPASRHIGPGGLCFHVRELGRRMRRVCAVTVVLKYSRNKNELPRWPAQW
jgi:hypothetical protein